MKNEILKICVDSAIETLAAKYGIEKKAMKAKLLENDQESELCKQFLKLSVLGFCATGQQDMI